MHAHCKRPRCVNVVDSAVTDEVDAFPVVNASLRLCFNDGMRLRSPVLGVGVRSAPPNRENPGPRSPPAFLQGEPSGRATHRLIVCVEFCNSMRQHRLCVLLKPVVAIDDNEDVVRAPACFVLTAA